MNPLITIHIIISILLIACILIQQSEAGVGAVFGGAESESLHHTRRGAEKIIFGTTIVLAVLFAIFSLLPLVLF